MKSMVGGLVSLGSPPRMRGKAGPEGQHHQPAGITPACAGKSMGALIADAAERDHPRVCGEKKSTIHSYLNSTGSPPRMRGKDYSLAVFGACIGITPAYAGKRPWPAPFVPGSGDHPRVCGEKLTCASKSSAFWGSPPRMRGKGSERHSGRANHGITPAYAGKSAVPNTVVGMFQDHPRVCGEKADSHIP